ncbi:MAG: hypothetical protein WBG92_15225 [Thiohalocapsa sp.]
MPFIGVLPERKRLFKPEPRRDVAVSDAAAWRLNPGHRQIYDKLRLALDAGLLAAPCGVDPADLGVGPETALFVKPIINLAGMSLGARAVRAGAVPTEPGSFWCERLSGPQTSSDCLVRDGEALWFAHTRASDAKDAERSIYWQIGADLPEQDAWLRGWIRKNLVGYTGLCNLELIGARPIEAHLRGSNGFFDFYGPDFVAAWAALADGQPFAPPPPIPGGYVISVFGEIELRDDQLRAAAAAGVDVQWDPHTAGRSAILRCIDRQAGFDVFHQLTGRSLT